MLCGSVLKLGFRAQHQQSVETQVSGILKSAQWQDTVEFSSLSFLLKPCQSVNFLVPTQQQAMATKSCLLKSSLQRHANGLTRLAPTSQGEAQCRSTAKTLQFSPTGRSLACRRTTHILAKEAASTQLCMSFLRAPRRTECPIKGLRRSFSNDNVALLTLKDRGRLRSSGGHNSRPKAINAGANREVSTEDKAGVNPDSNSQNAEVVIVGAGIAGLATALALHRVGIKSLVLESAPGPRDGGAAIALWRNAWRALDVLGVGEKLRHRYILLDRYDV